MDQRREAMLKMPALIREWKSVSLRLRLSWSTTLLMACTGWTEELDKMAQVRVYMVNIGHHLLCKHTQNMDINLLQLLHYSVKVHRGICYYVAFEVMRKGAKNAALVECPPSIWISTLENVHERLSQHRPVFPIKPLHTSSVLPLDAP